MKTLQKSSGMSASALRPAALKISAGILSFPDAVLEFMTELLSWLRQ